MDTDELPDAASPGKALIALIVCLLILVTAVAVAWLVQRDFGRVEVTNVIYDNKVFPMMMVNGTVWWFVWVNVIGFFLFRRWFRKRARESGLTWADLGISYRGDRFALDWAQIGKMVLLAAILFAVVYLAEHLLEALFIVDYRFIFPFASDLTPYRALMFSLYFPFLLLGFLLMGIFLHGQLRRPRKKTRLGTFVSWSASDVVWIHAFKRRAERSC